MAFTPSIGDILMLSDLAWKLGCAFTSGRKGAPAQFAEVESGLKSLARAIVLLGEALDDDKTDDLLARSDQRTKDGVGKILASCSQTLNNLEDFVGRYQDIRLSDEAGGVATQRSWKQVFIKNYKTIMWTTEGGNIQSLRSMLTMHTQSISLAMQALQSRSLSRLERVIEPVADQIGNIHSRLNGDLDVKIDELHSVILSLRDSIDSPPDMQPRPDLKSPRRDNHGLAEMTRTTSRQDSRQQQRSSTNSVEAPTLTQRTPDLSDSETAVSSPGLYSSRRESRRASGDRRPSELSTQEVFAFPEDSSTSDISRHRTRSSFHDSPVLQLFPTNSTLSKRPQDLLRAQTTILPPPALSVGSGASSLRSPSNARKPSSATDISSADSLPLFNLEDRQKFEGYLFRDAAILCDVRGTMTDYTQPDKDNPDELVMEKACGPCRICLITKKMSIQSGSYRNRTSVWVLSDDGKVRLQQELPEDEDVVPYTVWGNETKVVLQIPTELRYHHYSPDDKPKRTAKTSWINYHLVDERAAAEFQSILMSQPLLLTIQTKGTTRVHRGITAPFAYSQQVCGLENLRIFFDPHTRIATLWLHYHPSFHEGYLVFPLNDPRRMIYIREEDRVKLRVKGLDVVIPGKTKREGTEAKKNPERLITGVKIEFLDLAGKNEFLQKLKEIQDSTF